MEQSPEKSIKNSEEVLMHSEEADRSEMCEVTELEPELRQDTSSSSASSESSSTSDSSALSSEWISNFEADQMHDVLAEKVPEGFAGKPGSQTVSTYPWRLESICEAEIEDDMEETTAAIRLQRWFRKIRYEISLDEPVASRPHEMTLNCQSRPRFHSIPLSSPKFGVQSIIFNERNRISTSLPVSECHQTADLDSWALPAWMQVDMSPSISCSTAACCCREQTEPNMKSDTHYGFDVGIGSFDIGMSEHAEIVLESTITAI